MSQIKITQERSQIRCLDLHKRTLVALGLRKMNHSVVHEDTPQIRGMVEQVRYLVRVEPVVAGAPGAAESRPAARSVPKRAPAKRPAARRAAGKPRAAKRAPAKRTTAVRGAKKGGTR
jgi:large subunit ribosomal protein L30